MVIPTPAVAPTTPVQAHEVSTATELTPQPVQSKEPTQQELSISDLLFALTCYCYIFASKLGYEAINNLNQNLVVVLDNYSEVTAEQGAETISAAGMLADMKNDNAQAQKLANEVIGTSIPAPTEDEE